MNNADLNIILARYEHITSRRHQRESKEEPSKARSDRKEASCEETKRSMLLRIEEEVQKLLPCPIEGRGSRRGRES